MTRFNMPAVGDLDSLDQTRVVLFQSGRMVHTSLGNILSGAVYVTEDYSPSAGVRVIKFSDGRMVMRMDYSSGNTVDTTLLVEDPSIYRSDTGDQYNWTFSEGFTKAPHVTIGGSEFATIFFPYNTSSSGVIIRAVSFSGSKTGLDFSAKAEGRWS